MKTVHKEIVRLVPHRGAHGSPAGRAIQGRPAAGLNVRAHRIGAMLLLAAGLQILTAAVPMDAEARGFISFRFGVPLAFDLPVYYSAPSASSSQTQQACHEYQTTAVIDGKKQPVYGTACLQPDGSWRIGQ